MAPTADGCSSALSAVTARCGKNVAGDVLASLTTMVWNAPSESWTGGATMVAFAQIGIVVPDGQIKLEALRLYGLPEAAPALLSGTPALPVGQREFPVEVALDLPSLAAGTMRLANAAVVGIT